MTSVHPHIQVRGHGHLARDGSPKISYATVEKAIEAAERRPNFGTYECGDHWHIYRRGWPRFDGKHSSPPRGWLELDWELGVRVASCFRDENNRLRSHFLKLARTVRKKLAPPEPPGLPSTVRVIPPEGWRK